MSGTEYAIGTQFKTRGKYPRALCSDRRVQDLQFQRELVHVRYVAEHEFMGQKLVERDIVAVTIARVWFVA